MGALIKGEAEWFINLLVHLSDASPQDLLRATGHDNDNIANLISLATHLEMRQQIVIDHRIKDVLWAVLAKLATRYGERLLTLKEFIDGAGQIDSLRFSLWAIVLDDEEVKMKNLSFKGIDSNGSFTTAGLTADFLVNGIWMDQCAELMKTGMSGAKLCSFSKRDWTETVCDARGRCV